MVIGFLIVDLVGEYSSLDGKKATQSKLIQILASSIPIRLTISGTNKRCYNVSLDNNGCKFVRERKKF